MANYAKIYRQTWDEIESMPDDTKLLWFYLLSSKHGNAFGYFVMPEKWILDYFHWSKQRFFKAKLPISDKKMIYFDSNSDTYFIPNALKYNKPESPNVLISWRIMIEKMPKSSYFLDFCNAAKTYLSDTEWAKNWGFELSSLPLMATPKPSPKTSAKPSPKSLATPSPNPVTQNPEPRTLINNVPPIPTLTPNDSKKENNEGTDLNKNNDEATGEKVPLTTPPGKRAPGFVRFGDTDTFKALVAQANKRKAMAGAP